MTGIAPSQGPIPENLKLPTESPEGAAKETYQGQVKGEKVTQGFDKQNSMSVAKGVDAVAIMAPAADIRKPMLERPPLDDHISPEQLKSNSEDINLKLNTLHLTNEMQKAGADLEKTELAVASIDKLSTTDLKSEVSAIVNEHIDEIRRVLLDGRKDKTSSEVALTKGKLEEILQSMTDKLAKNHSEKMLNNIKAQAKLKAAMHTELMEKLEEQAATARLQSKPSCDQKVAEFFGISKKPNRPVSVRNEDSADFNKDIAVLRTKLQKAPGLASLLAGGLKDKDIAKVRDLLESRGLDSQVLSPATEDTMNALSMEDALAEGLTISHDSMSQAEFMRMLQQLQEVNENNEKLEEAIAALQSGDPKAAAEILKGMEGGIEGLSDENSQTLNTMIDALLNPEPLNAEERLQSNIETDLEHLQEVAQEADEQQKLLGEMSDLKTIVRG